MSHKLIHVSAASAAIVVVFGSSPFINLSAASDATPFAVEVIEYVRDKDAADNPAAAAGALGKTAAFTPAAPEWGTPAYVVTPFNATYAADDLVAIGDGGRLVLKLGQPAQVGAGRTLGVHAGVGLIDGNWPNGTILGPATPYSAFRSADVRVSGDGVNWVLLGSDLVFELPTNWYAAGVITPGAQETAGTAEADFTKPFGGTLSDFDDGGWSDTLAVLDDSAGGTWLDLSGVPLAAVNYVEFSVSGADEVMYVDAVVAVPEPAYAGAVLFGLLALRHGRVKRKCAGGIAR